MKTTKMMKLPSLILSMLGLCLIAPFAAADETPLEEEMSTISSAYKQLGRQARREKYDFDRLTTLFTEAKEACDKSIELVPAKIAKMTGAEKEKALEGYKKGMMAVGKAIDGVLASCKAKDDTNLKATYEKMKEMKSSGHEEYIED